MYVLKLYVILLCMLVCFYKQTNAQCFGGITTYPYSESFETTSGSWFSGGTNSDWMWGTPVKPVIKSAASGSKCWITGRLNGTSYNNAELSWLQSPCFDFSSLQNPQISFKVFWETERRFDGASFEYSIDEGGTWLKVGSANSNANCLGANWFNNASINTIGAGWSGNIQATSGSCLGGSGSGTWLLARHSLVNLAGQSKVLFRFTFGAGTTCNDYDGFAIDDITIGEAPVNTADFSYTCGIAKELSFTNNSSLCSSNFQWNFGDGASGVNNVSGAENPTHTFSAAGTYNVSLTVQFPNGSVASKTKTVTVIDASATSANVDCFGNATGTATVTVTGGNGPYAYQWNTAPVQTTATATSLTAGRYVVTISSPQSCTISTAVTITQPSRLVNTVQVINEKCNNHSASATAQVQGGVTPYNYQWSNGNATSFIQNVNAGNYSLSVTDENACTASASVVIKNINNQLNLFLGNDTTICPGEQLILMPGSFSSYLWQDNSTANTFTITQTGNYSVKVTDADGCAATDAIHVTVDCSDIVFPSAFTPNHDGLNDVFGAAGNLDLVKNYSLKVYSRWADVIFKTNDPYKGWNGKVKDLDANSDTFVWIAEYELLGKKRIQKGTLTLIR
jgi:gliding motility-associated-like protein